MEIEVISQPGELSVEDQELCRRTLAKVRETDGMCRAFAEELSASLSVEAADWLTPSEYTSRISDVLKDKFIWTLEDKISTPEVYDKPSNVDKLKLTRETLHYVKTVRELLETIRGGECRLFNFINETNGAVLHDGVVCNLKDIPINELSGDLVKSISEYTRTDLNDVVKALKDEMSGFSLMSIIASGDSVNVYTPEVFTSDTPITLLELQYIVNDSTSNGLSYLITKLSDYVTAIVTGSNNHQLHLDVLQRLHTVFSRSNPEVKLLYKLQS